MNHTRKGRFPTSDDTKLKWWALKVVHEVGSGSHQHCLTWRCGESQLLTWAKWMSTLLFGLWLSVAVIYQLIEAALCCLYHTTPSGLLPQARSFGASQVLSQGYTTVSFEAWGLSSLTGLYLVLDNADGVSNKEGLEESTRNCKQAAVKIFACRGKFGIHNKRCRNQRQLRLIPQSGFHRGPLLLAGGQATYVGGVMDLCALTFNSMSKNVAKMETERRQILKDSSVSRFPRTEERQSCYFKDGLRASSTSGNFGLCLSSGCVCMSR